MQEQVDQEMLTLENKYYLRSILLLTEGGSYISKKVLYRETDKNGGDLDTQLKKFERKLRHELHKKQCEKLFPTVGTTDVERWDLQMVIVVVHVLFHKTLSPAERDKLRILKINRNEVLAHNSSASLGEEEFTDLQEQLKDAIIKLSSGFNQDVKDKCLEYITKYDSGPLDIKSAVENMRKIQDNDVMFQKILAAIEGLKVDTHSDLQKQLSALEKRLMAKLNGLNPEAYQKRIKVGVHTELKVCGPSEEWINLMEKTLNDIFNEADKTAGGDFDEIKKTVERFLEIIRDKANFKGSTLKCIVLMFECTTYAELHSLLLYLNSLEYREELKKIGNSLMRFFGIDEHTEVTSFVTQKCLEAILIELDIKEISGNDGCSANESRNKECDEEEEQSKESKIPILEEDEILHRDSLVEAEKSKALQLAIECTSVEGLRHVWNLFQKGGATEHLNNIAEALSKHFGVKASLTAHLDLDEFKAAIEESVGDPVSEVHENENNKAVEKDTSTQIDSGQSKELFEVHESTLPASDSDGKISNRMISVTDGIRKPSFTDKAKSPPDWSDRIAKLQIPKKAIATDERMKLAVQMEKLNEKQLHVLCVGPVNSGKTKFIDSIASTLSDKVYSIASGGATDEISEEGTLQSTKERFQMYRLKDKRKSGNVYRSNVFIGDTPGLQETDGVQLKAIKSVIEGKVPIKWKIRGEKRKDSTKFKEHQQKKNRIHCVCFVFDISVSPDELPRNLKKKLRSLLRWLQDRDIPFVVILTKGDVVSDAVKEYKLNVFKNKIIRENKDKLINIFKFRQSRLFPVINYIQEDKIVPDSDALITAAFKEILELGKEYLEDIEDEDTQSDDSDGSDASYA